MAAYEYKEEFISTQDLLTKKISIQDFLNKWSKPGYEFVQMIELNDKLLIILKRSKQKSFVS